MKPEIEIAAIQKEINFISGTRIKLLKQGLPVNDLIVQELDDKIWYLMLRLYLLTEKNTGRKTRVLQDLGIHIN